MSKLKHALETIIWKYLHDAAEVEGLSGDLMELLEPTLFDERRAAAADMRERCINVCKLHYSEVLPDNLGYTIGEHMALTIREQIGELPLDSTGGA